MSPGVGLLAPDLGHHLLVVSRLHSLIQGLGTPESHSMNNSSTSSMVSMTLDMMIFRVNDKFDTVVGQRSTMGLNQIRYCDVACHMMCYSTWTNIGQIIPGKDTRAGIDVNGGVGKTVQQELLIDDVLAWVEFSFNRTMKTDRIWSNWCEEI